MPLEPETLTVLLELLLPLVVVLEVAVVGLVVLAMLVARVGLEEPQEEAEAVAAH